MEHSFIKKITKDDIRTYLYAEQQIILCQQDRRRRQFFVKRIKADIHANFLTIQQKKDGDKGTQFHRLEKKLPTTTFASICILK